MYIYIYIAFIRFHFFKRICIHMHRISSSHPTYPSLFVIYIKTSPINLVYLHLMQLY